MKTQKNPHDRRMAKVISVFPPFASAIVGAFAFLFVLAAGNLHAQPRQVSATDLIGKIVDNVSDYGQIDSAIKQLQDGDVNGCYETLKLAADGHPEIPPAGVLMAKLLFIAKNTNAAKAYLEKTTVDHPKDPDAYLMLSQLEFLSKNFASSEALLEKGTALTRDYSVNPKRRADFQMRVYKGLGQVAEARKKWDAAVRFYSGWSKAAAQDDQAWQRLGQAQFMNGDYQAAYESFKKAFALNPKLFRPEISMAMLYAQSDDQAKAEQFMNEGIKQGGNELPTRLAAARWMMEVGRFDDAIKQGLAATRIEPNSLDAMLLLGIAYRCKRDDANAEKVFGAAHLASPLNFAISNNLALALAEQADPKKQARALAFAKANQKLFPSNSEAASTLGWVYYKLGQNSNAQSVMEAARRSGKLSADGAYYVARMLYDQNLFKQAASFLSQARSGNLSFPLRADAKDLATLVQKGL